MSVFQVHFLDRNTSVLPVLATAYNFKPTGKFVWLQKFMWSALRKMGALSQHYDQQERVQYLRFETDDFMERLFHQKESLADNFGREASVLLIGSDEFSELMSCSRPDQYFSFLGEYMQYQDGRRTVMGLEIRVIPWMSGMVVI